MTAQTDRSARLQDLRDTIHEHKLDAYLVPRADEWQGEYVPARAERLSWLTGFTGSAGMAVIAAAKAAVFSDSRYTLQLNAQVDGADYDRETAGDNMSVEKWLLDNLPEGAKIGYDPRLHTVAEIEHRAKMLAEKKIELVPVDGNLVDAIRSDMPAHPADKVIVHDEKIAGKSSVDKRSEIAGEIKKAEAQALLLTEPDAIAWLLNIRGNDVPHTPFALSYAVLHDDGEVDWFIPSAKLTSEVKQHVGNHVRTHEFADMQARLAELTKNKTVMLDRSTVPVWFETVLKNAGAEIKYAANPVTARKAQKNETELRNIREAHIHDGVALVKFWKWIDEEAPKGKLTELDAVSKLAELRGLHKDYRDESFDAIVGWADHGAIVHYRATKESNARIKGDGLLLVDSGGQYVRGTTDNTRTVAIGTPTAEMKKMFTLVLKGHIDLAKYRFPEGTTGRDVETLARAPLRSAGHDFGHGTGHGVGAYLSVHEAGAGINSRFEKPLKPGMLISNEPGYYKENEFGIRIENLVEVVETGDDKLKYKFNTVSLTPIDLKLVDIDMLDADEIRWLNEYHKEVFDKLSPHLDGDEVKWLKAQTRQVSRGPGL